MILVEQDVMADSYQDKNKGLNDVMNLEIQGKFSFMAECWTLCGDIMLCFKCGYGIKVMVLQLNKELETLETLMG